MKTEKETENPSNRQKLLQWKSDVRIKWNNKCAKCNADGQVTKLDCHHLISAAFKRMRYDINNGLLLCSACHRFSRTSAHKGSMLFADWLMRTYPKIWHYIIREGKL